MQLPDSCPGCDDGEAAPLKLRSDLAYIRLLVAGLRLHLALKAGFNPDQLRDDHGRWTGTGGGSGGGGVRVAQASDVERYRVDLFEEEQKGGHTIAKHGGKTPETVAGYVRDSIRADPDPTRHSIRSGSFPSVEAANKLVNSTLARNRPIVDGVANGTLSERRVDAYFASVTGFEAYASTVRSQPRFRENLRCWRLHPARSGRQERLSCYHGLSTKPRLGANMTKSDECNIEFYHFGHGTEFRYVFASKTEYDRAKEFLDQLIGPRGVLPEHQRPGASADFYGINDEQYRAFRDFMRRQKP